MIPLNTWIPIGERNERTSAFLDSYPSNLVLLAFDDGSIKRYEEEHPFAMAIKVMFLSKP